MKGVVTKIAIGVGVGVAVAYVLGKVQVEKVQKVVKDLTFKIHSIRNVSFNLGNISLQVDVRLENGSTVDFSLDTGDLVRLKKIEFFTLKGVKIGEAEKEIANITLKSKSSTIIENVDAIIDTTNIGGLLGEFLTGMKPEDILVKAHLEIFGKPYII